MSWSCRRLRRPPWQRLGRYAGWSCPTAYWKFRADSNGGFGLLNELLLQEPGREGALEIPAFAAEEDAGAGHGDFRAEQAAAIRIDGGDEGDRAGGDEFDDLGQVEMAEDAGQDHGIEAFVDGGGGEVQVADDGAVEDEFGEGGFERGGEGGGGAEGAFSVEREGEIGGFGAGWEIAGGGEEIGRLHFDEIAAEEHGAGGELVVLAVAAAVGRLIAFAGAAGVDGEDEGTGLGEFEEVGVGGFAEGAGKEDGAAGAGGMEEQGGNGDAAFDGEFELFDADAGAGFVAEGAGGGGGGGDGPTEGGADGGEGDGGADGGEAAGFGEVEGADGLAGAGAGDLAGGGGVEERFFFG